MSTLSKLSDDVTFPNDSFYTVPDHPMGGGCQPVIRPHTPKNCIKMKEIGLVRPKIVYKEPPLVYLLHHTS